MIKYFISSTLFITSLGYSVVGLAYFAQPDNYDNDLLVNEQEEAYSITDAIKSGNPVIHIRPRYEYAKQSFKTNAQATTVKTTFGWQSQSYQGLKFNAKAIDVMALQKTYQDNSYVSSVRNQKYTRIDDPTGTGIAALNIQIKAPLSTLITIGRQDIQLYPGNFVGNNDFRQFPQSFDSINIVTYPYKNLRMFYSYAFKVNTSDHHANGIDSSRRIIYHILNFRYTEYSYADISAYLHYHKERNNFYPPHYNLGLSLHSSNYFTKTYGFGYMAEFTHQQHYFNTPQTSIHYYCQAALSKTLPFMTIIAGLERFSGHAHKTWHKFITPFAEQTKFMGYTNNFMLTPDRGIRNFYLKFLKTTTKWQPYASFHVFRYDTGEGSRQLGSELDLVTTINLDSQIQLQLGYAKFFTNSTNSIHCQRVWISLSLNLLNML